MEFRLNKIDTNIRKKLNDKVKANKIHGVKETFVIDEKLDNKNSKGKNKSLKKQYLKKGMYKIKAEKIIDKTKDEQGIFLDTKK